MTLAHCEEICRVTKQRWLFFAVAFVLTEFLVVLSGCTENSCRRDYRGTWSITRLSMDSVDSTVVPGPMIAPWISLQSNGVVDVPTGEYDVPAESAWNARCDDTVEAITIKNTATVFDGVYSVWSEQGELFARSHTKERTVELRYTPTILDQLEYR